MLRLLEGVKVLDLTRLLPGGYATLLLADMGAEILKIEDPWQGDYIRNMGPKLEEGDSAYFCALNRNKKSFKLNLKEREGREVFYNLIKMYDIVIEGFRPGVMDRLDLGYKKLSKLNPALIYCSLSGYGQDGPYRLRPGHDINYISIAGALGLSGKRGESPVLPAVQVADIGGGGLMSAIGVLAACINRQRTGKGLYIDVAMLDGVISWLTMYISDYFANGHKPKRGEMQLNGGQACYGVYRTRDGKYVSVGNLENKFWEEFCRVSARPELKDIQFSGEEKAFDAVQQFFSTKTRDEIVEMFNGVDTCIEPVLELDEVFEHPQVVHRGLISELEFPGGERVKTVRRPIKFHGPVEEKDGLPPSFGQHTEEVLIQLGYDRSQINDLKDHGVIG
ncbi:MAG: CaiB/BaiF CoA transferase family protein [Eubacteriales bacterium]